MSGFKDLTKRFAYKETGSAARIKPQIIQRSKPVKAEITFDKYKDLVPLPDILAQNLKLVFVGYNPSIKSSAVGHRFAHHSNQFWKLLFESGVVDKKLTYHDDYSMLEDYQIGFTELVKRPTKSADEIPNVEMRRNVPLLIERIDKFMPLVVCIVGKGIWEHILRFKGLKQKQFDWGLQDIDQYKIFKVSQVFVVPSTSGLVRIPKEEQLKLWKQLKSLMSQVDLGLES